MPWSDCTTGNRTRRIDTYQLRKKWEKRHGPVEWDKDKNLLHKCDNPPCDNLDHIFIGTLSENQIDCITKGRKIGSEGGLFENGERHWNSRLSEDDILNIRRSTKSQRQLADEYGINQSAISRIRSNKRWKHIKGGD